jgi:hypothetical protein
MLGIAFACIGVGIIITMLGFAISRGSARNRDNHYSFSDTVEGVESIDIDVKFCTVDIENGDEFSVEVSNMTENGFKSYVEDGIWYLEDDYDEDNIIDFFGIEIPISQGWFGWDFGIDEDYAPYIVITIPEDFIAKNVKIDIGAGDLDMEELNTSDCDLRVGAGNLDISNLETINADLNCGFGRIKITGQIIGDLSAGCGMGAIKLDLIGEEEDYNYYINCGFGNVGINGDNYSFISHRNIRNEDSIGSFDLNCGFGSIDVEVR